jgi:FkbM family methyltransferase
MNIKNKLFNPLYKTQLINIGGKELKVYSGTFTKIDKDDAWLAFLMKDCKVFFDIGANIGWTALLANIYGRPQYVVLVEPNPMALTRAAGNLIMNDFALNATFIKAFVSNKHGERVKFFTIDTGSAGSMYPSHAKTASFLNSWYWVSTITLDELSDQLKMVPDLIKIDVEGAEHLVLLGALKISSMQQVRFFVEMHSNQNLSMNENANNIIHWCKDNNYRAWYLTTGEELFSASQIASRGRCHLLLLPLGTDYPTQLKKIQQGDPLPNLT